jgi:hypothetical protein
MSQPGSRQYKSQVVRYEPKLRYASWGGFALLLLAAIVVAYWLGGLSSEKWRDTLEIVNAQQKATIAKLERDVALTSRQLTTHELNVELGRRASEALRQTLVGLQQENADLQEQITFYKGLMDPDMNGNISFRGVKVLAGPAEGEFVVSAVVQQLSLNHTVVKGTLRWRLAGELYDDEGKNSEVELTGGDFASGGVLKLRFKYFQNITDSIVLPRGFVPKTLYIDVKVSGKESVEVNSQLSWDSLIE